ncbi:Beta-porphyranase A [Pontiella desulfatans]|uniref:Beta-porphyranase A n=1 Tax=Pontiella desulfatans TaxID=2750659 RepID=A0A6C2TYW6_PONDE|nr:beta-agarase [Pontiella desulfatans]VGO12779.1 Beta-porphyranase A [Pontiella desulfatans]
MKNTHGFIVGVVWLVASTALAETVEVELDPACVRNIGGVTAFDRAQFITIHDGFGSTDINEHDVRYLEDELEVRYGRDGGFITWMAAEVGADPAKPEMPNLQDLKDVLKKYREEVEPFRMVPKHMRDVVFCTHPEQMHGFADNTFTAWGPRTPEATAELTAQLLKHGFSDEERPRFLEVYNEPFVKAKKIPATIESMCEQHNVVAKRVKELTPNVLVGGYAAAWVEVEDRNFEHWNGWQKTFMDIAGENMDFWSYHIYDGVNVMGSPRNRTGSNSEAIMDLIDTYSHIKFGVAKPIMITEYGKIPGGNMNSMPYSAERSAGMLYSAMGQLMTFMDHPDRLLKTIPFFLGKATWTYGMTNDHVPGEANPFLLWRKTAEGDYVETDLTLFYQFWKGVEGEWRKSASSNPDVRVHALHDGKRLNVAFMNLDEDAKRVGLSGLDGIQAAAVSLRTLTTHGRKPVLGQRTMDKVPASLELEPGEAALLMIDLGTALKPKRGVREHRIYATEYLKDIEAGKPVVFNYPNTPTGNGSALLRVSAGRKLGRKILPDSVRFNGHELSIPTNWAGDDQAGRANYFGMIEIPVGMDLVRDANTVEVRYPDAGGKVASVVLQVNRMEEL